MPDEHGATCDFCDEGLPLKDGWHERTDSEGVEGVQRIPCQKTQPPDPVDLIRRYDYEDEGLGGT